MFELTWIVIAGLKTLTLTLGGLVAYRAFTAYERPKSRPLFALSAGFAIVTVGSLSAGVLDAALPVAREAAIVVEGFFTVVGFGVVLYSIQS